jgi:hypothetical protein
VQAYFRATKAAFKLGEFDDATKQAAAGLESECSTPFIFGQLLRNVIQPADWSRRKTGL